MNSLNIEKSSFTDILASMSLSNVGETKSICLSQFSSQDQQGRSGHTDINCYSGFISKLYFTGVIPQTEFQKDNEKLFHDFCGDPSQSTGLIKQCTNLHLDKDGLTQGFKSKCQGKHECKIDLYSYAKIGLKNDNECYGNFTRVYV